MTTQKIETMAAKELKLFVIEFNKASQLDRSMAKLGLSKEDKIEFRRLLIDCCINLMNSIDSNTITNSSIRKEILSLSKTNGHTSFGQAQKVVNVCLKQYCFLTKKYNLLKELDCPLDSTTIKGRGITNNRMISVTWDDYVHYQTIFEKEYAMRVLADEKYDDTRIERFLAAE